MEKLDARNRDTFGDSHTQTDLGIQFLESKYSTYVKLESQKLCYIVSKKHNAIAWQKCIAFLQVASANSH